MKGGVSSYQCSAVRRRRGRSGEREEEIITETNARRHRRRSILDVMLRPHGRRIKVFAFPPAEPDVSSLRQVSYCTCYSFISKSALVLRAVFPCLMSQREEKRPGRRHTGAFSPRR